MPEIPDNLTPAERAVVNHASFVAAYNQFLRPHAVPARSGRGRIAGRRRPGASRLRAGKGLFATHFNELEGSDRAKPNTA